eukprot:gene4834-biopygen11559
MRPRPAAGRGMRRCCDTAATPSQSLLWRLNSPRHRGLLLFTTLPVPLLPPLGLVVALRGVGLDHLALLLTDVLVHDAGQRRVLRVQVELLDRDLLLARPHAAHRGLQLLL